MKDSKTRVVLIRLPSRDLKEIERRALYERMSINTYITQSLKSNIEWEHIAPIIGLVPFQKRIIKDLIDQTPEAKEKEIAYKNADLSTANLQELGRKVSLESFLQVTRLEARKSGFTFTEHIDEEGNMMLVTQHRMGRGWSDFINAYNERLLSNLGYLVDTDARENLWIARIRQE